MRYEKFDCRSVRVHFIEYSGQKNVLMKLEEV